MVENPANAIAVEMAGKVDQEMRVKHIEEIASRGAHDPASLAADEVKSLCETILAHLGGSSST